MGFLKLMPFKIAVPKPKRKRNTSGITRASNKIIRGIVFKDDDGIFKVKVDTENNSVDSNVVILEFTERSYDLTGKVTVFLRTIDNNNRYIRFIRTESNAKFMPGLPEQYIPFAPNWIVKGYIVNDNGNKKFDFTSLVGLDGYKTDITT